MASSDDRPPTPTSRYPPTTDECRFTTYGLPTEWAEKYRPGRFHPVNIGDKFHDGRYGVIRKLGYGGFSTVWLAQDYTHDRLVALKVVSATTDDKPKHELVINQFLNSHTAQENDPNITDYVVLLLDHFTHTGPNGTHLCLTFEPVGPPLSYLFENLPPSLARHVSTDKCEDRPLLPLSLAKRVIKDVLHGVAALHTHGVVHGDIQPNNVLMKTWPVSAKEAEELTQEVPGYDYNLRPPSPEQIWKSQKLVRKDGKKDLWAPTYLLLERPLIDQVKYGDTAGAMISDLGQAFYESEPPKEVATPLSNRAPELLLGASLDRAIDVWSVACLIYWLLTGLELVLDQTFGRMTPFAFDDFLQDMIDCLGPLPPSLSQLWPRKTRYYDSSWTKIRSAVRDEDVEDDKPIQVGESLEEGFMKERNPEIGESEAREILELLRGMLCLEAARRWDVRECLSHPWMARV